MKNRFLQCFLCSLSAMMLSACSDAREPVSELPPPAITEPDADESGDGGLYPKDEGALRIVQYNVGYFDKYVANSIPMVVSMMTELEADIVGFNELDYMNGRHDIDQIAQFAHGMKGWKSVCGPSAAWNGGHIGVGIAWNPAVTGELVDEHFISLPNDGEDRGCLVLEFDSFIFATTHLEVSSSSERLKEVQTITARIKEWYSGKDKPVFFGGDMNEYSNSAAVIWLGTDWDRLSCEKATFQNGTCIDMIFGLKGEGSYELLGSDVGTGLKSADASKASDHFPVYIDVKLNNN